MQEREEGKKDNLDIFSIQISQKKGNNDDITSGETNIKTNVTTGA